MSDADFLRSDSTSHPVRLLSTADQVTSVATDLVATVIAFLAGAAGRRALRAWRYRKARRFWRPLIENDTTAVIGFFEDGRLSAFFDADPPISFEPSGVIGVGDAFALNELTEAFAKIGANLHAEYVPLVTNEQRRASLILLGAPDVNILTGDAMAPLKIDFGSEGMEFYDHILNSSFKPHRNDRGAIEEDFGYIARINNPYNKGTKTLIVAGCTGFGTWAGVRLLNASWFQAKYISLQNFECIYSCKVNQMRLQEPEVRSVRSLE